MQLSRKELHDLLIVAYLDARRHERPAPAQLRYELKLESNLSRLTDLIYRRQWRPAPQTCFIITRPSVREVFAPSFEDRVVSHLLFNMLAPLAERMFIYDSYSCRKGKGTLFGVQRFEHFLRGATENWSRTAYVLSVDITGYFMHINKAILYSLVCDMLSTYSGRGSDNGKKWSDVIDCRLADYLSGVIIFRNPADNCIRIGSKEDWRPLPPQKSQFNSPLGTGITIGDVMSQLFSNIYMNPFDQFCKRDLRLRRYGRYVDDARAIDADAEYLETCIPVMDDFLQSRLKLTLHPVKTVVKSTKGDNMFLGAACREYRRYAANKTIASFVNAVRKIELGLVRSGAPLNLELATSQLNSYLSYLRHFNEYKVLDRVLHDSALNEVFDFSENYRKAKLKTILKQSDYAQIYLC